MNFIYDMFPDLSQTLKFKTFLLISLNYSVKHFFCNNSLVTQNNNYQCHYKSGENFKYLMFKLIINMFLFTYLFLVLGIEPCACRVPDAPHLLMLDIFHMLIGHLNIFFLKKNYFATWD